MLPEHRWIVIKPNLVELKPSGSGVITDCRVVKAVTRMVHEIAPEARITIAEGSGGWLSPGHEEETGRNGVDGFEPTGYRALMTDPDLEGVNLDLFDLNFDESEKLVPVGGGHALDAYWIPKTVLECDVFINVPVLKVIRTIGMTVALKNMVGIAPGNKYGWGKDLGEPPGRGPALPHELGVIDEMIVDLATSRWWMRSWGWSGVRPRARRGVRTARKMVWAGIGCRCWRRIVMGTYGLWSTITGATGTRWRISMGRGGFLRNRSAGSAPFLQIVGGEYG